MKSARILSRKSQKKPRNIARRLTFFDVSLILSATYIEMMLLWRRKSNDMGIHSDEVIAATNAIPAENMTAMVVKKVWAD